MRGQDRWRMVLGRYAKNRLPPASAGGDSDDADAAGQGNDAARMEAALDFLYSREYVGRGVREETITGTLDPSQLTVPKWIGEVKTLFPRETAETIERHALERYGMTELVTDPEVLQRLEPSMDLLKTVMAFKEQMKGPVLEIARRIVRQVVEDLKAKLQTEIRRAFSGQLNRFRRSPLHIASNFDWKRTIRENLKNFDPERQQIVLERLSFFSRSEQRIPYEVILCVDQSGSMAGSVIHAAVMAGILTTLPSVRARLVVFDVEVVDLSEHMEDPVQTLMSVQLGGGTDIANAITFCESLVERPRRTILVLVSDFGEGGSPARLVAAVRRMAESGVRMLGLAALDEESNPYYDRQMAEQLVGAGMEIAALTPARLAKWLAEKVR